ncbi:sensor histidine kinase [Notoacmeibacter ruber]|uniref:C4-dicarboxylate transport sensor protein DctB n=1 Tax=Notoacmeibacter ruber TaxID=2670375 RepID=A0A3L7JBJ8_9HYPH|nr:ATP-binding protein [Notoacmeibacter ruber]RLQ88128.1 sensor histidine kinase [Notoacmeibacter ruber]
MAVRSGYAVRRKFRLLTWCLLITVALSGCLLVFALRQLAEDRTMADLRRQADETLVLQSSALTDYLEKFRLLPPLLAGRISVQNIFVLDSAGTGIAEAKRTAGYAGARDVLFLRPDGSVFASAYGDFDGYDFSDMDLLRAAKQNRLGRQTLREPGGQPLYAFASAVRQDGRLLGAIAVLVGLERLENVWALSREPILVTWNDSVLFGNRPSWKGKPFHSQEGEGGLILSSDAEGGLVRLSVDGELGPSRSHYLSSLYLPLLEWRLHAMVGAGALSRAVDMATTIGVLAAVLAGLAGLTLLKRSEISALRLRNERAQALRLERRVRDRTGELLRVNQSLASEVEVRQMAERQLRQTQSELIHTAKLAVLGQMSATLSHEYNQPIAAVRSQADNARTFLERGQGEKADRALSHIIRLTERMAELSRSLLGFARKPGSDVSPTVLAAALDEALMLTGPRLRKDGITLDRTGIAPSLKVMGGRLRLTQVFVNLINNSADALQGRGVEPGLTPKPGAGRIAISAEEESAMCVIRVEDNGPGLPVSQLDSVFEPFVSTKGVGEGLGVGLSVVDSIVTGFGGTVSTGTSGLGGACFEIRLPLAPRDSADRMEKNSETA